MPEKISVLGATAYWTAEEAEKYDRSTAVHKTQTEMTQRILTALGPPPRSLVLDVGCGTGFSMEAIEAFGCIPVGLDISIEMLKLAKAKGLRLLVRGDFRALPFRDGSFDALVSVSTLQWVVGKNIEEIREQYKTIADESNRVLKPGGKAGVQFYPATPAEFEMVKKAFKSAAFGGHVLEEGSGKKLKRYLILEKKW